MKQFDPAAYTELACGCLIAKNGSGDCIPMCSSNDLCSRKIDEFERAIFDFCEALNESIVEPLDEGVQ